MHKTILSVTLVCAALVVDTSAFADPKLKSDACFVFEDNQRVTVRGQIVQSATTMGSEGEPPHKYMALVLDNPICFSKDPGEKINFIEVAPVSMKWLGHDVTIIGNMTAGDAWSITVRAIKDVSFAE